MKTILEYQKNYWFNNSMITEAFKSKILQEISDQLNNRIKKQKEEAENDKTHYHRSPDTGATFKKLFAWRGISWSDITDDMFKEYSSEDPEGIITEWVDVADGVGDYRLHLWLPLKEELYLERKPAALNADSKTRKITAPNAKVLYKKANEQLHHFQH